MSTDTLHAFLAGCYWPAAAALPAAIAAWIFERVAIRRRIRENAAGGLCPHGRSRFKLCLDCAREFAAAVPAPIASMGDLNPRAPVGPLGPISGISGIAAAITGYSHLGAALGAVGQTPVPRPPKHDHFGPRRFVVRTYDGPARLEIPRPVILRSHQTPLQFRIRRHYHDDGCAGDWMRSTPEGVAALMVAGTWFIEIETRGFEVVEFIVIDAALYVPTL